MTRLLLSILAVAALGGCAATHSTLASAAPPDNPANAGDFLYDWNKPEPPRSDEIAKGLLIPPPPPSRVAP